MGALHDWNLKRSQKLVLDKIPTKSSACVANKQQADQPESCPLHGHLTLHCGLWPSALVCLMLQSLLSGSRKTWTSRAWWPS